MKRFLLISGLFLLFGTNARAFTCYDGFELKEYPDGTKYCEYNGGYTNYPVCNTVGEDVDMYWDMATQKCVACNDTYSTCDVKIYREDGTTEPYGKKTCTEEFGVGCNKCNKWKCLGCWGNAWGGYTLIGGKCVMDCPAHCSSCSSSSTCTQCDSGYTLKNGQCVKPCPANCSECNSSGVCTQCNSGYKLKDGACEVGSVISCPDDMKLSADGCCCIAG